MQSSENAKTGPGWLAGPRRSDYDPHSCGMYPCANEQSSGVILEVGVGVLTNLKALHAGPSR